MRSWGLGHHTAIMTYPHHDAKATFAIMQSAVKNWVIFELENAMREQLPEFLTQISSNEAYLPSYKERLKAETIHLYTSDLL